MIARDAAIRKDLARGLINIRALARFIQQATGNEASLDSVISTIRRYPIQPRGTKQIPADLLDNCKIGMRNKIAYITLANTQEVQRCFSKITSVVNTSRGEIFRFIAGVATLKILVDEKNLERVCEILPKHGILSIARNNAEIIVFLPEEAKNTPGIVATISNEMALNDINIAEIMSCVPELVVIVNERDTLRTYQVIESLTNHKAPRKYDTLAKNVDRREAIESRAN